MTKITDGLWSTISSEPMPDGMDYDTFVYIRRGKWNKEDKDFEIDQLKFFLSFKDRIESEETKRKVDEIIKQLIK